MKQLCKYLIVSIVISLAMSHTCADEKIDAVVAEMKQTLAVRGFPLEMFDHDQERVDQIQLNTTWWAFEPELATVFQKYYRNTSAPKGHFWRADSFLSANADYEEAVMRAIWGDNHTHLRVISVADTIYGVPGEIRRDLQSGTRLNSTKIAEHIQSLLRNAGLEASIGNVDQQTGTICEVTTAFQRPPEGLSEWYRDHLQWAIRIRVSETSGANQTVAAGMAYHSPKSRIVLRGHLVVMAKDRNRAIEVGPVFENSFRKNGSDPFNVFGEGWVLRAYTKEGHFNSGGIQMMGPFTNRSPLLLMTDGSAAPGFIEPLQLKIANSMLADSTLWFESAGQPIARPKAVAVPAPPVP